MLLLVFFSTSGLSKTFHLMLVDDASAPSVDAVLQSTLIIFKYDLF